MKSACIILLAAVGAWSTPALAQTYQAGMANLDIRDPDGQRDLEGVVWYPTLETEPMSYDFESEVWAGTQIVREARPADDQFPLIVLSHGMFGNAYNQAWFAAAMAQRGFVVAAINHPGTSTWLRDPDQRRALWERPRDVSRVIDHAMTSPDLSARIDPNRVFMAGHSLGGFTALALAGGRYDADGLNRFCDNFGPELACDILADWKIAQTPDDRAQMETDLSDPRIRAFALFDLGGTQSFSRASLGRIDRPMIVFGAPIMNSGLTLDIESRALVKALTPGIADYIEPETLSHFDFLGVCKPGGFEILQREEPGDEVVCNGGGAPRAVKHSMIVDAVASFFDGT